MCKITSQILFGFSLAFLTHFHGHAFNLAVGEIIRAERLLRDTMDNTSELFKLTIKSPERNAMLFKLKEDLSLVNPGFRVLYPTQWTRRTGSLKSVLDKRNAINMLWDNSLEET